MKLKTEIAIHQTLQHPHIARFLAAWDDATNVYILLELCAGPTLADVVKSQGRLSESTAVRYMYQILDALQYLHASRCVRRVHRATNTIEEDSPGSRASSHYMPLRSAPLLAHLPPRRPCRRWPTLAHPHPTVPLPFLRPRVIHRDLKLSNLFTDAEGNIKVGDFGLACQLQYDGERKNTICGTPNYIAPEILTGGQGHSYEVRAGR